MPPKSRAPGLPLIGISQVAAQQAVREREAASDQPSFGSIDLDKQLKGSPLFGDIFIKDKPYDPNGELFKFIEKATASAKQTDAPQEHITLACALAYLNPDWVANDNNTPQLSEHLSLLYKTFDTHLPSDVPDTPGDKTRWAAEFAFAWSLGWRHPKDLEEDEETFDKLDEFSKLRSAQALTELFHIATIRFNKIGWEQIATWIGWSVGKAEAELFDETLKEGDKPQSGKHPLACFKKIKQTKKIPSSVRIDITHRATDLFRMEENKSNSDKHLDNLPTGSLLLPNWFGYNTSYIECSRKKKDGSENYLSKTKKQKTLSEYFYNACASNQALKSGLPGIETSLLHCAMTQVFSIQIQNIAYPIYRIEDLSESDQKHTRLGGIDLHEEFQEHQNLIRSAPDPASNLLYSYTYRPTQHGALEGFYIAYPTIAFQHTFYSMKAFHRVTPQQAKSKKDSLLFIEAKDQKEGKEILDAKISASLIPSRNYRVSKQKKRLARYRTNTNSIDSYDQEDQGDQLFHSYRKFREAILDNEHVIRQKCHANKDAFDAIISYLNENPGDSDSLLSKFVKAIKKEYRQSTFEKVMREIVLSIDVFPEYLSDEVNTH